MLLTAAGFKLHGLLYRPYAAGSPFLSRTAEFALLEGEVLLALWLLSGWRQVGAWRVASVVFGIFGLASLYLVWLGRSSCGCFGEVTVSPWLTLGLDLLVLALLCGFRPVPALLSDGNPTRSHNTSWRPVAYVLGSVAVVVAGGVLLLMLSGISPAQALARLRGDRVLVDPATVDGGSAPRGTSKTVTLHLQNPTDRPIRIIGGTADCSCIATDDLPLTLAPGAAHALHVRFKFTGAPGLFKRTYWLYTDDPQQPVVLAWIAGSVVP